MMENPKCPICQAVMWFEGIGSPQKPILRHPPSKTCKASLKVFTQPQFDEFCEKKTLVVTEEVALEPQPEPDVKVTATVSQPELGEGPPKPASETKSAGAPPPPPPPASGK